MHEGKWFMVVSLVLLSNVETKLSCTFVDDRLRYMECTSSGSDSNLTRGVVSDNNRVVSVTLKLCGLLNLNANCFDGLPLLEKMDLSQNKLTTLPLGVLDKVPKLTYFNASYNRITSLPVGLFDRIQTLLQLELTGNHLYEVKPGLIKKASMLYLSKNFLQGRDLHPNVFESSDINFLLLNENDMMGAPDNILGKQRELLYLNLNDCSLAEVPKFIMTQNLGTITHLTIAKNKISEINDATIFNNLNNLEVLNLTMNLIEHINGNLFKPLIKLKKLDLSMNRLNTISKHQFRNSQLLTDVDLSHNFITTLPVDAFRGTTLSTLNLSNNRITYLQDNFCLELRNSGAVLRNFYFSGNPWQCACLRHLFSEVKVMNVKYDDINYDGEHPVCVTTGQFVCKRQEYENRVFIDMYDSIRTA